MRGRYRRMGWRSHRHGFHRPIFLWFGVAILATGVLVSSVFSWFSSGPRAESEVDRIRRFAAGRFSKVWDRPSDRDELARAIADELKLDLVLFDSQGRTLAELGASCQSPILRVPVESKGQVWFCADRRRFGGWHPIVPLLVLGGLLWAVSGKVARRITRPLSELARVAQDLGEGKLSSRANLGRRARGEVLVLAEAINEMAARIEKQLSDQRELLAAVSHELRTPLGHIRLLVELAREGRAEALDELDQEIVEIDQLVGQLLASSRVDFGALRPVRLQADQVARKALERSGLGAAAIELDAEGSFEADPTLIARALANLIDNAQRHGGSVLRLSIRPSGGWIRFAVEDGGPGFSPSAVEGAFEPFSGGSKDARSAGLGLGLSLVKRIAQAHGGRVFAANRPEGGASVGFELPAV